jgi:hypothetical protein
LVAASAVGALVLAVVVEPHADPGDASVLLGLVAVGLLVVAVQAGAERPWTRRVGRPAATSRPGSTEGAVGGPDGDPPPLP